MYTLTNNEALLPKALLALGRMTKAPGRCLGYIRAALGTIGLHLPPPQVPHSTALACYELLSKNPGAYGWVKITDPGAHPVTLVFFNNCGRETDGDGSSFICGHVALKMGDTLYSSENYTWDQYWADRLVGAYVPA